MQVKDASEQTVGVTYVNYLGQPVATMPVKVKREAKDRVAYHKGWAAFGITKAQVEAARRKAASLGHGFDMDVFMRNAKMERITRTNYSSPHSAQLACDLAMKDGYVHVEVREMKRE
jgi:hypothetical protein